MQNNPNAEQNAIGVIVLSISLSSGSEIPGQESWYR